MKEKYSPKNIALFVISNLVSCFASCMCLKANIGSGAYSALSKTAAPLLNIKIGYVQIIMNSICVLTEFICLKKKFGIRHILQFPMITITGIITNFFYYDVLGNLVMNNYVLRVITLVVADFVNAAAVAMLLNLDIVTTALGGACHVVSQTLKTNYAIIRQSVDIICVVGVLICHFIFKGELSIREGTIISMIEFGHFVDFWLARTKKIINKKED